ncbi:MAG: hypothetical protein HY537_17605 [Deltaproteobacteria bacterium]|nr:hypothetical protein [Deltaproteobacteria bacterium]
MKAILVFAGLVLIFLESPSVGLAAGKWRPISREGAPSPRYSPVMLWTGHELFVWGGGNSSGYFASGALYNPVTDTWKPINSEGAPAIRRKYHGVWTGTEVILWDGIWGKRYNPLTDQWKEMNRVNAPSDRTEFSMVWTGTRLIVVGGFGHDVSLKTCGSYDPIADRWFAIAPLPEPRQNVVTVWTGSRLLAWGGGLWKKDRSGYEVGFYNTGHTYDPVKDEWKAISKVGVPIAREDATGIWTGKELVVWGGLTVHLLEDDLWLEWLNTGGIYNPKKDKWRATSTRNAPSGRKWHTMQWTGEKVIVWGGSHNNMTTNDGGIFDPVSNSWMKIPSSIDSPSNRVLASSAWTGKEFIVWGGMSWDQRYGALNDGGIYTP